MQCAVRFSRPSPTHRCLPRGTVGSSWTRPAPGALQSLSHMPGVPAWGPLLGARPLHWQEERAWKPQERYRCKKKRGCLAANLPEGYGKRNRRDPVQQRSEHAHVRVHRGAFNLTPPGPEESAGRFAAGPRGTRGSLTPRPLEISAGTRPALPHSRILRNASKVGVMTKEHLEVQLTHTKRQCLKNSICIKSRECFQESWNDGSDLSA